MSSKFQGQAGSPIVSWIYLYLICIYLKLEWIVVGEGGRLNIFVFYFLFKEVLLIWLLMMVLLMWWMLCFLILYFDFFYICLLQGVLDHSIRRSKTTYQAMSPNDLKKIAEVYKKGQEMMREIGVIIKTRNFCFLYFFFV